MATGNVFVTDHGSAALSVFNGSLCNAGVHTGCNRPSLEQAVGSQPNGLIVGPGTGTVYVLNSPVSSSVSLVAG
jgi:DNA-binding beta-propeller fold protein YncE